MIISSRHTSDSYFCPELCFLIRKLFAHDSNDLNSDDVIKPNEFNIQYVKHLLFELECSKKLEKLDQKLVHTVRVGSTTSRPNLEHGLVRHPTLTAINSMSTDLV
jgi:hypothetical protein